jgi:hypothetical protein
MSNILIRKFVRKVLLEGQFEKRIEQVKGNKKFEQHDKLIDQLVQGLTSANLRNVGYFNWGLKQIQQARAVELGTIASEIVSVLVQFDKLKGGLPKKDIMHWKTLGELRGAIEQRIAAREKSGDARKKRGDEMRKMAAAADENLAKAIKESDILLGGNTPDELATSKLIVVHPHTKFASQYWGNPAEFACDINIVQGSTKWCTSATRSKNYFDQYAGDNTHLYYIIDKRREPNDVWYKIAYAITEGDIEWGSDDPVYDIEIFDSADESLGVDTVKAALGKSVYEKVDDIINDHYDKSEGTKVVKDLRAAFDKQTPPQQLIKMAESGSTDVRAAVATNPSTPPEAFIRLVADTDLNVLEKLVFNMNRDAFPDKAKIKLVKTAPEEIRKQIAKFAATDLADNPIGRGLRVPKKVFDILVDDPSINVIYKLVDNLGVPPWVQEKIYEKYSKNYSLIEDPDHYEWFRLMNKLAASERTPLHILKKILDLNIRNFDALENRYSGPMRGLLNLADNSQLSPDMLKSLYELNKPPINLRLAANIDTPVDILEKISNIDHDWTRAKVAENPSTPVHVLDKLSKDQQSNKVRAAVAVNRNTPAPVLIRLAGDNFPGTRRAIVDNPNSPVEALRIIAQDANSDWVYDTGNLAIKKLRKMGEWE